MNRFLFILMLITASCSCATKNKQVDAGDAIKATAAENKVDRNTIRYHWSGGLSMYDYYTLTIEEAKEGADVNFVMKPVNGESKTVTDQLSSESYLEISNLLTQVKFSDLTQKPRGMKIFDIGKTVITWHGVNQAPVERFEDTDTIVSGDIKPLKSWFDQKVRTYLDRIAAQEAKLQN